GTDIFLDEAYHRVIADQRLRRQRELDELSPPHSRQHSLKGRYRLPPCIKRSDKSADACPGNDINRNIRLLQHLQDTDMSRSPRCAAAECKPDFRPRPRLANTAEPEMLVQDRPAPAGNKSILHDPLQLLYIAREIRIHPHHIH